MAKRERCTNWEKEEKQLLKEIIRPFSTIIENKDISTNTNKEKIQAWSDVTEKFNTANIRQRTKKQLVNQWKLIKLHSKKEVSNYRREAFKTGGGPKPPSPSPDTLDILEMLPQEFEVDSNEFDSDGFKDNSEPSQIIEVEPDENKTNMDVILIKVDEKDKIKQEKKLKSLLFKTPKQAVKRTPKRALKETQASGNCFNFGESSYEDMHSFRLLENERLQKEHELRIKNMSEQHQMLMENLRLQNLILKKNLDS